MTMMKLNPSNFNSPSIKSIDVSSHICCGIGSDINKPVSNNALYYSFDI